MKRELLTLTLSLGIGLILLTAQALHAEGANCGDRGQILERLAQDYGETRQSIGLAAQGQVLEVFASTATGTWTITVTLPSGQTCLVAAGEAFERVDEELTPAMLGEPA